MTDQTPTLTLGELRALTENLPDDLPLTVYVPSQGWWVNLELDPEIVERQRERFRLEAADEPHDAEMSLVLNAREDFDTRQW